MIYYWIDSNIWFPRLTFSMMALWSAVQTKGFVSWLKAYAVVPGNPVPAAPVGLSPA